MTGCHIHSLIIKSNKIPPKVGSKSAKKANSRQQLLVLTETGKGEEENKNPAPFTYKTKTIQAQW
jgi:hypothetical protein